MSSNIAEFRFWDVQHGSACYISTPNGKNVVIDLGVGDISADEEGFSPLAQLQSEGVTKLDVVVITHPHTDHLDDIFEFEKMKPTVLLRPKHLSEQEVRVANRSDDSEILDEYFKIDQRYSEPANEITNSLLQEVNGGLSFKHFHPKTSAKTNLNNHSIVTVASFAGLKVLIPGDNEASSWKELLENPSFVDAVKGTDVLVASHHGRESGFCDELFQHFTPRLTIISDGPFTGTSATDKYCSKTKGWNVYKPDGSSEERKCLTTRTDGTIVVKIGMDSGRPFLNVVTEL